MGTLSEGIWGQGHGAATTQFRSSMTGFFFLFVCFILFVCSAVVVSSDEHSRLLVLCSGQYCRTGGV